MAQHHDNHDSMVPQNTNFDNADQPGIAQPYSQSEIEDLLYGDDRPASERLARLRAMREESAIRESGDWGGQDPASMLEELDRAIDELSATIANAEEEKDFSGLATTFDNDPDDRLDTMAPDDEDARYAITGEDEILDEEEEAALLEEPEWDGGDEFRTDRNLN